MSQLQVLQDKMKGLRDEADALFKARKDGLTDEQAERLKTIGGEIREVGGEIDKIKSTDGLWDELDAMLKFAAQPAGKTAPLLNPGSDDADDGKRRESFVKSLREGSLGAWMKSDAFQRFAKHGVDAGQTSGSFRLGPQFQRGGAGPLLKGDESADRFKTLIYEGATANIVNDIRLPGVVRGDTRENVVADAFTPGRTDGTSVSYVRESVVTNNAAAIVEATSTSPGPAGAQFPESTITFAIASENVKNVGHMIPVTQEILQDVAFMDSYVRARMIEMLEDKIDAELLTGAGGNSLVGLYNVSGITDLDEATIAAFNLPSAGDPGENVDRLLYARVYNRVVNKARGTHVLMHPYDLAKIEMIRDANGLYLFPNGIGTKIRMEIIETESATQGYPLVVDNRHLALVDKMETSVEITNSNREWFEYRILALAVWWRGMSIAMRPASIVTVEFA
jgi:HK97 family phage major capsid protein